MKYLFIFLFLSLLGCQRESIKPNPGVASQTINAEYQMIAMAKTHQLITLERNRTIYEQKINLIHAGKMINTNHNGVDDLMLYGRYVAQIDQLIVQVKDVHPETKLLNQRE